VTWRTCDTHKLAVRMMPAIARFTLRITLVSVCIVLTVIEFNGDRSGFYDEWNHGHNGIVSR